MDIFLATDPSTYNLAVEFLSIQTIDSKEISADDKQIDFVNYFNETQTYKINARFAWLSTGL